MNQRLRQALREAYEAPEPKCKKAFFEQLEEPGIRRWQVVLVQAAYIRKRVWLLSFVIFAAAMLSGNLIEKESLWMLSALTPFLAVSFVVEMMRSEIFGMAELEMTARFSLRSVVLARMGLIGMVHAATLCIAAAWSCRAGGMELLRTGVYLFVPYLLTVTLGLWISRRLHGKDAAYAGMGIAAIVSILPAVGSYMTEWFYDADGFVWWLAAMIILCGLNALECRKKIKRTEELIWNS